jgi:hypothetical protein
LASGLGFQGTFNMLLNSQISYKQAYFSSYSGIFNLYILFPVVLSFTEVQFPTCQALAMISPWMPGFNGAAGGASSSYAGTRSDCSTQRWRMHK